MNARYVKLMLWVVALVVIGAVIGSLTKGEVNTWYRSLNVSPLTPPDYVFGVVWSILYAVIAASGWLIWEEKSHQLKYMYSLQLISNWCWMPLFFGCHLIGAALLCLAVTLFLVAALIIKSYERLQVVSLLLMPYLLWLLFAGYLNFYTWLHN